MGYTVLKDHSDYSINRNGQIRAVKTKEIVKQTTENGYKKVSLDNDTFYVHRLVAIQFLKKPIGKDEVDHLDHNRGNNRISNLRWSNRS